jgi:hypothetical protein
MLVALELEPFRPSQTEMQELHFRSGYALMMSLAGRVDRDASPSTSPFCCGDWSDVNVPSLAALGQTINGLTVCDRGL